MTRDLKLTKKTKTINSKLNITISKQKSILDGLTLEETINIDLLNRLINSDVLETINNKKYNKMYDNNKIHLENYRAKYIKNKKIIKVNYKITQIGYGRVSVIGSLSLGSMKREIRHTLAKEYYVDIDIVNAHPNIIHQICIHNNIQCKQLTKYINEREIILDDIMKEYNVLRDPAKDLFIILMYGGFYKTWADNNNINKKENKFIREFHDEIQNIGNIIICQNSELENKVKQLKQKQKEEYHIGCSLSYYAQEYERQILEVVYLYLQNTNTIKNNCVLCFDGLMIPKIKYNDDLLDCLSKEVYEKLGFSLKFTTKNMDKDLLAKLDEEYNDDTNFNIEYLKTFNSDYFDTLKNYDIKKIYWEKFCCKIMFPEVYYIFIQYENNNKHMEILKKNFLKEAYVHLTFESLDDNGNYISIPFIDEWLKDKNIRRYHRIDFIPCNEVEPKQTHEYFNLFSGWNPLVKTKYDISKSDLALSVFFDLGKTLCENNIQYFNYFMKFLAHMIQKPSERIPIAFIIKGKQGTGKNVFLNAICNIMDKKNYICSSNANDFFGNYAEGFYHKLLVNINECEGKDTFDYEGRIKSFITEEKIILNPKFQRPTEINNYSRLIIFSNKATPIPIDVKTGDRRFVVFQTGDKYLDKIEYDSKFWKILIDQFKKPQFIACLYDYLNCLDISDWNFDVDRPITDSYIEMCKLFIPVECLFFEELIYSQDYIKYINLEISIESDFKNNIKYNETIYINGFSIYNFFTNWAKKMGLHKENSPSIKNFYGKIKELGLPIDKVLINGSTNLKFIPKNIYNFLLDKKLLSFNNDPIKPPTIVSNKNYDHLIVF
jgi:hypothetical protein